MTPSLLGTWYFKKFIYTTVVHAGVRMLLPTIVGLGIYKGLLQVVTDKNL